MSSGVRVDTKSKKNILITGARGFIGRNLTARIKSQYPSFTVIEMGRNDLSTINEIIRDIDFVFHLAGENRPKNVSDFKKNNVDFTKSLISELSRQNHPAPIVFSSSIQAALDNEYGLSKREAEEAIAEYGVSTGASVYIYRLKNVFGKWSKPNYNSVVATFCHNIVHEVPLEISDTKKVVSLIHIDDVVESFLKCLENNPSGESANLTVEPSYDITLGNLADKLSAYRNLRLSQTVPDLSSAFDKALYGTYSSFYDLKELSVEPELFSDDRGWLFELLKSPSAGQVFVSSTNPGFTRGDHWHHTKVEKFCVIKGSGILHFRLFGTEEITSYELSDSKIQIVDVPTGYIHSIENNSHNEMILVIWASEVLDKNRPDTYYEKVKKR